MIRFFIGSVFKVKEDQTILFNVPYWADFISDDPPSATPAVKVNRYPQIDDEVLVLQPDSRFEVFMYFLTPDDKFDVSMNYGDAVIKIVNGGDDENPDYVITADNASGSTVVMRKGEISTSVGSSSSIKVTDDSIELVKGTQKIVMENGKTEIQSSTGNVSLNGTATTGIGPFCSIPNCLFTGAPHGGSQVTLSKGLTVN